jgi:uncharacterized protein YutE (UPF0331/DUF86 family)
MNGVIVSKLADIEETVRHLRALLPATLDAFVTDWASQRMTERAPQIVVEAMIDPGERLVALGGGPPCETAASAFDRLQEIGIIRDASRYVPIVRVRNFLVHQYDRVDPSIVYGIATDGLADVEAFVVEVKHYCENH